MERLTVEEVLAQALQDVDDLPIGFTDALCKIVVQSGDRPLALRRLVEESANE